MDYGHLIKGKSYHVGFTGFLDLAPELQYFGIRHKTQGKHNVNACKLLIITLATLVGSVALADTVSLDMHQAQSGNFYVRASMAGTVDTDLLLDTGSGYVSLSQSTFDRVSASSEPQFTRHIFGRMANGKVEKVALYTIAELRLAENCVLRDIEVAVFPKADRDILGLNALSRMQPFTMQLAPAKLTSAGCTA